MGYLFLFFLSNNLIKNNKIEVICYYEFVDVMKSTNREQLCQDMSVSIFILKSEFILKFLDVRN